MQAHLQHYGPAEMCGFTSDGVIYVVLDGQVISKSIDVESPPTAGLPFGLHNGQTPEQTIAALQTSTDVPMRVMTFPGNGARYVSHDNVLKNANDYPFLLTLLFVNDRLVQVLLQDPSAPTD